MSSFSLLFCPFNKYDVFMVHSFFFFSHLFENDFLTLLELMCYQIGSYDKFCWKIYVLLVFEKYCCGVLMNITNIFINQYFNVSIFFFTGACSVLDSPANVGQDAT